MIQGKEVLRVFYSYQEKRSLLDDFTHYDTKQVHREQVTQYQAPVRFLMYLYSFMYAMANIPS